MIKEPVYHTKKIFTILFLSIIYFISHFNAWLANLIINLLTNAVFAYALCWQQKQLYPTKPVDFMFNFSLFTGLGIILLEYFL